MNTIVEGGSIVNEGKTFKGSILISDEEVVGVIPMAPFPLPFPPSTLMPQVATFFLASLTVMCISASQV